MISSAYLRYQEFLKQKESGQLFTKLNDNVLVVDGLNTFLRVFAAIPVCNEDGIHIGALSGFLKSVASVIKIFNCTRCVIVFDGKGGSMRRKKLFPGYKAGRTFKFNFTRPDHLLRSPDEEEASMKHQMYRLGLYFEHLPISIVCVDHIEADDAIAYITTDILKDSKITILSADKDFLQLVDDRVSVWSPTKKILFDPKTVKEIYNIYPQNFLLYRMFMGDKSDCIDGVKGIGDKTIRKLFPILFEDNKVDLSELIEYCNNHITDTKGYQKTLDNKEILERNFELMRLRDIDFASVLKLEIHDILDRNIHRLNTYELKKLMFQDKLYSDIPNFESWSRESFGFLDTCVSQKPNS